MGADIPKVFLRLSDADDTPSIIQRTVGIFARDSRCEHIVVCVHSEWRSRFEEELQSFDNVVLIAGGGTRQESVRCGVEALYGVVGAPNVARCCVLIHDAARCCVSSEVVQRVIEGVYAHGAVTAAVPVPDTLSKIHDGVVRSFVDRESVWAIQTPQGFWLEELRSAHYAAQVDGFAAFDDASIVSRLREVRVVEGERFNIKVTHPSDLDVAARISNLG